MFPVYTPPPPPPPPSIRAYHTFLPSVMAYENVYQVCDNYYCEPTRGYVDEFGTMILKVTDEGLFNVWTQDTEPGDVWTGEVVQIGDKFYYCYAVDAWDDLDWQRLELWPQATLVMYIYMDETYYIGLFEEVVQYKIIQSK